MTETNSVLCVGTPNKKIIKKGRLVTENEEKETWDREEMRAKWPRVESFGGIKRKSKDLSPLSLLSYFFFFLYPEYSIKNDFVPSEKQLDQDNFVQHEGSFRMFKYRMKAI